MTYKGSRHRLGMSQREYAAKLERILRGMESDTLSERGRSDNLSHTPPASNPAKLSDCKPGVDEIFTEPVHYSDILSDLTEDADAESP